MSDINQICVSGRLTRDPEVRQAGQSPVLCFSVACGRSWTNKQTGNREERTTFFDCEVWGSRAESLAPYLRKGDRVTVTGAHEGNQREMQDGSKRTFWTLRVSDIALPPKPRGQATQPAQDYDAGLQAQVTQGFQQAAGAYYDEALPF